MVSRKNILLCSTGLAILAMPSLVHAQEVAQTEVAEAASEQERDGVIIVTATRREERLNDVPISISSVSGDMLSKVGVADTRDLANVAPSLRIESIGPFVQPAIRGVTSTSTLPSADPNVATYLDGVYQQNTVGAIYDLPDVRQVQVLRGPQGTLFGRNATGGAIIVTTLDPEFDAQGQVSAGVERFGTVYGRAFVTAPLIDDVLAFSLSGYAHHQGSFRRNALNNYNRENSDTDTYLVRGKMRLVPADGVEFILTGLYSDRNDHENYYYTSYQGSNVANLIAPGTVIPTGPYDYAANVPGSVHFKSRSVSLRGTIEAGPGEISSTTSYINTTGRLIGDNDGTALPIISVDIGVFSRTFTQELIYSLDDAGPLKGVAGFYYYNNEAGNNPLTFNDLAAVIWYEDRAESWAGFGEFTYDVSDRFSLTAGARYTHENVRGTGFFTAGTIVEPASLPVIGERSFNSFTPRVSALYRVSDATNIYASYSRGFKSGGFNSQNFQTAPYDPETLDAFEVGVKTSGRDLSLNLAAFYYDYSNLQVTAIETGAGGSVTTLLANAASSEIYGLEVDGSWRITPEFNLSFGAAYLHAEYSSFPNASVQSPIFTDFTSSCDFRSGTSALIGNQTLSCDVSGNRAIRSPKLSGNLTANYTVPIGDGDLGFSGTVYYSSKVYFDSQNRIVQPAAATVNARVAWRPNVDSGFELAAYGRNLTSSDVIQSVISTTVADLTRYNPPTVYGLELRYSF
ncbi:TonB-dependent receptor [Parasphingorhabdus sp.]|uniref:TonB-dependent receptor n=1 Tax=Parasphingorhabdus sp. TaxID=2709688 RepID=UPI003A8DD924